MINNYCTSFLHAITHFQTKMENTKRSKCFLSTISTTKSTFFFFPANILTQSTHEALFLFTILLLYSFCHSDRDKCAAVWSCYPHIYGAVNFLVLFSLRPTPQVLKIFLIPPPFQRHFTLVISFPPPRPALPGFHGRCSQAKESIQPPYLAGIPPAVTKMQVDPLLFCSQLEHLLASVSPPPYPTTQRTSASRCMKRRV